MKKIFLSGLLLFAAAATLSNCSKDETTDLATTAQTTISATLGESTRTILDGASVKWVANDKILLANASGLTAAYTLTADGGAGTTSGIFSGNDLGAGEKFALYPYSATATCASGKFSFEMPATQAYAAKTFGNGANPMIAKSDDKGVLNFQNMCGVIKLTLKGTQKIGKIEVSTATTAEKLSGSATVAFDADGLPVLTMDEAAANTVTLNCNNAQLDAATATSFYVVVPAATYAKGLQFEIYDETGAFINSLLTSKDLIVTRSQVAPLSEKTIATAHFPDARFRAMLTAAPYNLILTTDGTDIDVNDDSNKAKFTTTAMIIVHNKQIASLKGIEYFTGLEILICMNNLLTSLDLSKNTALISLVCENNQLTSLDFSKNTALGHLECCRNLLKSLDVSKNTALTYLNCYDNQMQSLDVSKNTALTDLKCHTNQLQSLDVSKNTALSFLDCRYNQLPSLDVSKNTVLNSLGCTDNQLTSLDVSKNTALIALCCDKNQLTSLDVSKNKKLIDLYCHENLLKSLDIQPLTSLSTLFCGQQLAGGVVAPSYSELKLYMTQAQYDANLGTKIYNDHVTRVVPVGK